MSSIIQLLPDHVANQIAAGEVVQRPASVVKELLENAVDAGATEIKLIVKDSGKTLVQVIDNGVGMNITDARMSFERHATSKIRHAEDLFAIHTKGFRGEALASIAAVAHVEMKTRKDDDELGTHIIIEGSKLISQEPAVLPKGTSFSVKNLFFNIPARRNFLKSESVEMRHVADEFQRVALAHPSVSFSLINNGSELHNLPQSNLRQRIVNMFGSKTNEKLVPLVEDTEILHIQGFVSKPEFSKKTKGEQFFFVNGRFIKSGYLHHAVMSAYDGLLKDGMQPGYFIYLDVPPNSIDINIHPTKTEIKFEDEHSLYAILRAAVKHSLGQFNVAPILDFERDPNLDIPYDYQNKQTETPTIQIDTGFNPFADDKPIKSRMSGSAFSSYKEKKSEMPVWGSLYAGLKNETEDIEMIPIESGTIGLSFDDTEAETVTTQTWQIHRKYIVSPIKSGMMIIDQQRAHQRILYEHNLSSMTIQQASSQQLLFPVELFYTPAEMLFLQELIPSLESMGFVFGSQQKDSITVNGIPVNMTESQISVVLEELFLHLQNETNGSFSQNDMIAKSLSKSLAVRTGTFLNSKERENIVNSLFACKQPDVSPFNKPIFITITVDELDKKFSI